MAGARNSINSRHHDSFCPHSWSVWITLKTVILDPANAKWYTDAEDEPNYELTRRDSAFFLDWIYPREDQLGLGRYGYRDCYGRCRCAAAFVRGITSASTYAEASQSQVLSKFEAAPRRSPRNLRMSAPTRKSNRRSSSTASTEPRLMCLMTPPPGNQGLLH